MYAIRSYYGSEPRAAFAAFFCFWSLKRQRSMRIFVNEQPLELDNGVTLLALRDRCKPDADLLIRNGFPQRDDAALTDGRNNFV